MNFLQQSDKAEFILKLLVILNMVDAIFTLWYLNLGVAEEANPILSYYYAIHPCFFVLVKNILFSGSIYILYRRLLSHRLAPMLVTTITALYGLVIVYHLIGPHLSGVRFLGGETRLLAMNLIGF